MELLRSNRFHEVGINRKEIFMNLDRPMMPSKFVMKIYKSNSNTYFLILFLVLFIRVEERNEFEL